jgi:hypothetical protein
MMGFIKSKNYNIVISKKTEQNNSIENKESKNKNKHKSYGSIRKNVTEDSNIIEKDSKTNNSIKKDSISIGI